MMSRQSVYFAACLARILFSVRTASADALVPTLLGLPESFQGTSLKNDTIPNKPGIKIEPPTPEDCFRVAITNCFIPGPTWSTPFILCEELTPHLQGGCTQDVILEYNITNALGPENIVATGGADEFGISNAVFSTSVLANSTPTELNLCGDPEYEITIGGAANISNVFFGCAEASASFSVTLDSPMPSMSPSPPPSALPTMNPTTSFSPTDGTEASPTPSPSISAAPSRIAGKKGKKAGKKTSKKGKYYEYSCSAEIGDDTTAAPSMRTPKGTKKGSSYPSQPSSSPRPTRSPRTSKAPKSAKSGKKGAPKEITCENCIDFMDSEEIDVPDFVEDINVYYSVEIFIKDEYDNMTKAEIEEAVLEVLNGIFKADLSGCSNIQVKGRRLETEEENSILSFANFTDLEVDGRTERLGLCTAGNDDFPGAVCRGGEGAAMIRYSMGEDEDVTETFTELLNKNAREISGYVIQVEDMVFKKVSTKERNLVNRSDFVMSLSWIIPVMMVGVLFIVYGSFIVIRHGKQTDEYDNLHDDIPLVSSKHPRSDDINFPIPSPKKWSSVTPGQEVTDDTLDGTSIPGTIRTREYEFPTISHVLVDDEDIDDNVKNAGTELSNEISELNYYGRSWN